MYSTYLGGSTTDWGVGIAVNSAGEAFVVGRTELAPNQTVSDFPIFPSPIQVTQGTPGGGVDTFVARLSADGSALVYSTYLGGRRSDEPSAIAIDPAGSAYVLGSSFNEFPITVGPIGPGPIFFSAGIFITKVSPDGARFVYSTVVNANSSSFGSAIAADATGHAYVAGSTAATNFPTTSGQPCGGGDALVFKLLPDGSGFEYLTCLGGDGATEALAITLDSVDSAYVTGATQSTTFPGVTASSYQPTNHGVSDAFVTQLDSSGHVVASTYLGGGLRDSGNGIAVDGVGNVLVVGKTSSGDFPLVAPLWSTVLFSMAFVAKLNADLSALLFSSYLGDCATGAAIGVDGGDNPYVTGDTHTSCAFPVLDRVGPGGGADTFVTKITLVGDTPTSTTLTSSPNPSGAGVAVTFTATVTGSNPTGVVVFRDGANNLGSAPLVGNSAQLSVSTLTIGDHSITALYSGDANNRTSKSVALIHRVGGSATAIFRCPVPIHLSSDRRSPSPRR